MKEKSVKGNYWVSDYLDEDFVRQLKINLDINDITSRILSQRVRSVEEGYHFIYPKIKNLMPDPFHLRDMDKAVLRLIEAIENADNICIFADYDVDGATSSALIKNILREVGHSNVSIYVPDRIIEGYGPSEVAMQKIYDSGVKLLITVDCGAVAFDALSHAASIGLDVVVIDHHMSLEQIPQAVAVVNPNRLDEVSECKNLAAVGVSFLFMCGLIKRLKEKSFFEKNNVTPPDLLNQLDIVALGTVCDVMTLTGLNRAFVTQGLRVASRRKNIGYIALCNIASIDDKINCYHLGFVLGPRINAGGRVGTASLGSTLLSTNSETEATMIAKRLEVLNQERRAIESNIFNQAQIMSMQQYDDAIIFVSGEGWHPGVIGIVAGKLKEKYNKPVVVIAVNDGYGKASCRSIAGVDFGCIIMEAKNRGLLVSGGGHAMAAGFTVKAELLSDLKKFLHEQIVKFINIYDTHLRIRYDIEIPIQAINRDLVESINVIEPFGNGNPTPVVKISNVYIMNPKIVGHNHISFLLIQDKIKHLKSISIKAIIFDGVGTPLEKVVFSKIKNTISVLGCLKMSRWNGVESLQIQIKDILIHNFG